MESQTRDGKVNMDEFENEAVVSEDFDIYAGWGDDPGPAETIEETPEETAETESDETDQSEADEAEDASDDESAEASEEPVDEEPGKEADQSFTLKHLDEVREVNRDEVIALAQKGLDYDRIRTERDSLKAEKATLQDHEDFLKELAEMAGTSIEDLMVTTKARLVVADEKKKGNAITLEQAKYRVQSDMKAAKKAEPAAEPKEDPKAKDDALNENFMRFRREYPDVKAEDIPKEVWAEFGDGKKELTECYRRYENKQLKARIKDLEQKKVRSTGSRKSNGSPIKEDDLYVGWG